MLGLDLKPRSDASSRYRVFLTILLPPTVPFSSWVCPRSLLLAAETGSSSVCVFGAWGPLRPLEMSSSRKGGSRGYLALPLARCDLGQAIPFLQFCFLFCRTRAVPSVIPVLVCSGLSLFQHSKPCVPRNPSVLGKAEPPLPFVKLVKGIDILCNQ